MWEQTVAGHEEDKPIAASNRRGRKLCGYHGGYPINLALLFSSITGFLKKSRLDSIPPSNVKSVIEIIARFILWCDRSCRMMIMTGKPPILRWMGECFNGREEDQYVR